MGIVASRDTRRISFNNNFAITPPIAAIQKSIDAEHAIVYENIPPEPATDSLFAEKYSDFQEGGETDYWAQRIEYLKKEHQIINKIVETEFDKSIETTNQVFEIPKSTPERLQKIKPCFDWRSKILQCYEDNPHQPLVCAAAVQAFAKCVSACRMEE